MLSSLSQHYHHLTLLLGPCIELCLHCCLLPVLRAANVDAGSICQQVLSSILGIIAADCIAAALGIYCNNVHSGELSSILNQGLILSSRQPPILMMVPQNE